MMYTLKYYVNKEKRTVVCVLECDEFSAVDFVERNHSIRGEYFAHDYKKYVMPMRFEGKAKCAPEDEFDEELGKLIAFDRAKAKYDRALMSNTRNLIEMLYENFIAADHKAMRYRHNAVKHHEQRLFEIENKLKR